MSSTTDRWDRRGGRILQAVGLTILVLCMIAVASIVFGGLVWVAVRVWDAAL